MCRYGIWKAKAQLVLNLVRNSKNSKKGIYRYTDQHMKIKKNVPSNK